METAEVVPGETQPSLTSKKSTPSTTTTETTRRCDEKNCNREASQSAGSMTTMKKKKMKHKKSSSSSKSTPATNKKKSARDGAAATGHCLRQENYEQGQNHHEARSTNVNQASTAASNRRTGSSNKLNHRETTEMGNKKTRDRDRAATTASRDRTKHKNDLETRKNNLAISKPDLTKKMELKKQDPNENTSVPRPNKVPGASLAASSNGETSPTVREVPQLVPKPRTLAVHSSCPPPPRGAPNGGVWGLGYDTPRYGRCMVACSGLAVMIAGAVLRLFLPYPWSLAGYFLIIGSFILMCVACCGRRTAENLYRVDRRYYTENGKRKRFEDVFDFTPTTVPSISIVDTDEVEC